MICKNNSTKMQVMGRLSDRLTVYYQKKGNKIVFINGDSLNKLSLKIGERLKFSFDSATLSRVINGKRLFTNSQLRTFCSVLRLKKGEKLSLFKALTHDLITREGITSEVLYKKHLYTKILETAILEDHQFVDDVGKLPQKLQFASYVLEQIGKKIYEKYPKLWKNQKETIVCAILVSKSGSKWWLFKI